MENDNKVATAVIAPTKQEIESQIAWARFAGFSEIKYFWKDMNRRFLGVSKSFLDYYGFESEDVLIGKTDEDMGWHIANNQFKFDEEDVLDTGKCIVNVAGKCLLKGVLHEIYTNKKTIYRDGEIIGLFGFFVDADSINGNGYKPRADIDRITGLCNTRGIFESCSYFQDEYDAKQKNIVLIGVQAEGYKEHVKNYGEVEGNKYLKAVTEVLLKHYQTKAIIGRLRSNKFVKLTRYGDAEVLQNELKLLKEDLHAITEVNGNACCCEPYVVTYDASTVSALEEAMGAVWTASYKQNAIVSRNIIEMLSAEYDGLIYLNLDTLEASRIKHSGEFNLEFITNYETLWNVYSAYVEAKINPEARTEVLDMGTLDGMRKSLSDRKIYEQEYVDLDGHKCKMRLVKQEAADVAAHHVLVAFRMEKL